MARGPPVIDYVPGWFPTYSNDDCPWVKRNVLWCLQDQETGREENYVCISFLILVIQTNSGQWDGGPSVFIGSVITPL